MTDRRGATLDIARSGTAIGLLSLGATALAYWLQLFLATEFGVGRQSDVYLAASALPMAVGAALQMGMSIVLVPLLPAGEDQLEAKSAAIPEASLLGLFTGGAAALAILLALFARPVFQHVAPGIAAPEAWTVGATVLRLLAAALPLQVASAVLAARQVARGRPRELFVSQLLLHGASLVGAIAAAERLGIVAIAAAVIFGSAVQLAYLSARSHRPLTRRGSRPRGDGLRLVLARLLPWLAAAMIAKSHPVVDRYIASLDREGSVAALGFALALVQIGVLIASKGISWTVLPRLAQEAGDGHSVRATTDVALRLVVWAVVPVWTGLVLLRHDAVVLAFGWNDLSAVDARRIAAALLLSSGAVVAMAIGAVVNTVHYARGDTLAPAIIGLAGFAVHVTVALALTGALGYLAPAVALSVASTTAVLLSLAWLWRRAAAPDVPVLLGSTARALAAGAAMAGLIAAVRWAALGGIVPAVPPGPLAAALAGGLAGSVGLVGYVATLVLLTPGAGLRSGWRSAG